MIISILMQPIGLQALIHHKILRCYWSLVGKEGSVPEVTVCKVEVYVRNLSLVIKCPDVNELINQNLARHM